MKVTTFPYRGGIIERFCIEFEENKIKQLSIFIKDGIRYDYSHIKVCCFVRNMDGKIDIKEFPFPEYFDLSRLCFQWPGFAGIKEIQMIRSKHFNWIL